MSPQIATANRLGDGLVVFLGSEGWVERIEHASVAHSDSEVKALDALVKQSEAINEVVSGYLVEVEPGAAGPRPLHYREMLRTLGPSVRLDLGKQAQG
jgi:sulfite reductase (NADPH) hemoprotein beta-component